MNSAGYNTFCWDKSRLRKCNECIRKARCLTFLCICNTCTFHNTGMHCIHNLKDKNVGLCDKLFFVSFSAESKWEELHPGGERPPALQEHSAVAYKDCLYVFGGELGFSAGTETPLWVYNVKVILCKI